MALLKDAMKAGSDVVKTGADAVKDWRGENTRRQANSFGHEERMLEIKYAKIAQCIGVASDAVRVLADSYAVVCEARTNRERVHAEIAQNYEKELWVHQQEAAKVAQMAEKLRVELSEKEKEGEAGRESLRVFVDKLSKEYERYLELKDEEFLSEEVTRRLSDLRSSIVELTQNLMQVGRTDASDEKK